ncbi:MAG: hypothetical protein M1839_004569 [Geoglossum umbratile]|nr:MAG: hypothetical protein M1839_004569 [Geoglossum umbratile]
MQATRPAPHPEVPVIALVIIDSLIAAWQYCIISPALYPVDHQGLNDVPIFYWILISIELFVGFFVMFLNLSFFGPFGWKFLDKTQKAAGFTAGVVFFVVWSAVALFVSIGCFVAPFIAYPVGWKMNFRNSCNGFEHRINLDLNSVHFQHLPTSEAFTMTLSPDPNERRSQVYRFNVDPVPSPPPYRSAPGFYPSYDSITYDFPTGTYTAKSSNSTILHAGHFAFDPVLYIPDLNISADVSAFVKGRAYRPFLKVYDSTDDVDIHYRKHSWADNSHVVMRTAAFSPCGTLFLCARAQDADVRGLGELSPVVVGLLVLVNSR